MVADAMLCAVGGSHGHWCSNIGLERTAEPPYEHWILNALLKTDRVHLSPHEIGHRAILPKCREPTQKDRRRLVRGMVGSHSKDQTLKHRTDYEKGMGPRLESVGKG